MLEYANNLLNKLIIRVRFRDNFSNNRNILAFVQDIVHKQLSLPIDFETFTRGGIYNASDSSLYIQAASAERDAVYWSAKIEKRETNKSRRWWQYFFSISKRSEDCIDFRYAKCCHDHLAGSTNVPVPIPSSRDSFPDALFFNQSILCCSGGRIIPDAPIELNTASLPSFIELLQDKRRVLPIILISCTDIVSPEMLADFTLGNTIVYWVADPSVITRLNRILPDNLATPWDSVRVFFSLKNGKAFHPVYYYEEIYRKGSSAFLTGMQQAYCQGLRAEEQKNFLTVSDVLKIRSEFQIDILISQLAELAAKLEQCERANHALTEQSQSWAGKLEDQIKKSASCLEEYEILLSESFSEAETLKKGISQIVIDLCNDMGASFKPREEESHPELKELYRAIYASLARVSSNR